MLFLLLANVGLGLGGWFGIVEYNNQAGVGLIHAVIAHLHWVNLVAHLKRLIYLPLNKSQFWLQLLQLLN
ncbi:Uncharacterised protein [Acinetobacter baumannii]|nr:Uncharacterised protein [Acinetobacter baumannii]SVK02921.1 Uncharacterised protein [Acinetobacter baumannii]